MNPADLPWDEDYDDELETLLASGEPDDAWWWAEWAA